MNSSFLKVALKENTKLKEEGSPMDDYAYLLHHANSRSGFLMEELRHCFVYDHIGNLFVIGHFTVSKGEVKSAGKKLPDGVYHMIVGLEPSQEVVWSDTEAEGAKIKPKRMFAGMKKTEKAKEW